MRVRVLAIFSGRVQGVFFRANCQNFSNEHGLDGWVRNREDGRVEALFEGEEKAINAVIDLCRYSQPYAHIESVELEWREPKGDLKGFRIKY